MVTNLSEYKSILLSYSTVHDYLRYSYESPELVGPKGDLKDVQRPWALDMVRQYIPQGVKLSIREGLHVN